MVLVPYVKWTWAEKDLNLRRLSSADLQSAAIDRSAICPYVYLTMYISKNYTGDCIFMMPNIKRKPITITPNQNNKYPALVEPKFFSARAMPQNISTRLPEKYRIDHPVPIQTIPRMICANILIMLYGMKYISGQRDSNPYRQSWSLPCYTNYIISASLSDWYRLIQIYFWAWNARWFFI